MIDRIEMKYFRIQLDPSYVSWYLSQPVDDNQQHVDARLFTYGEEFVGSLPREIPVGESGPRADFNFAAFDMLVVKESINAAIAAAFNPRIQRFPVQIEGGIAGYEILNVLEVVECFDFEKSKFTVRSESDGNPVQAKDLFGVYKLRIDPARAAGHAIFRIAEWSVAVIISEDVKNLFERLNVSGVKYVEVA
jgi:hypothetical protein